MSEGIKPRGTSFQATVHWKGQRFRKDWPTEVEAKAWRETTLEQLKAGKSPEGAAADPSKITTFGELADYVVANHWRVKGQSSADWSIRNTEELKQHFGALTKLDKVNYAAIEALKTVLLKKGKANGTVNRKLATLSKVLTEGQKLELKLGAQRFIKPVIDFLPEAEGRIRTVSEIEEEQLVRVALLKGDQDMADYVVLSVDTGMRQGEALKVTTAHVAVAPGSNSVSAIVLTGDICKSKKGRTIPLTDRAATIWMRRIETLPAGSKLFPELTKAAIRHRWATLLETCGIDDETLVPHTMRHTFCSRLADAGAEAPDIQKLAGHSTLAMSQKYIHISGRRLANAIALLNKTPHATPEATGANAAGSNPEMDTSNVLKFFKKPA
jgi:integrase